MHLLSARHPGGYDGNITARIDRGPAFSSQSGPDGILDSLDEQGILDLDLFPREGLVLAEVRAAIIVCLHLLR